MLAVNHCQPTARPCQHIKYITSLSLSRRCCIVSLRRACNNVYNRSSNSSSYATYSVCVYMGSALFAQYIITGSLRCGPQLQCRAYMHGISLACVYVGMFVWPRYIVDMNVYVIHTTIPATMYILH